MSGIREEFEEWYAAEFFEGDSDAAAEWLVKEPVCGAYLHRRPAEFFMVWQASRAAMKVELPPTITVEEAAEHFNIDEDGIDMAVGIAHMVNGAIWSCAAFIKQAGIEVKP